MPPWFFNEWVELCYWLRWEIIWLQKLEASPFAKSKCPDLEIAGFRWQLDQVSKVPAYGKDSPSWHSSSSKRSSNHHIPIWQCLHLDLVPATARWSPDGNGYWETYVSRRDTLTALSPIISSKHEDVSWITCRNINSTLSIYFMGIGRKPNSYFYLHKPFGAGPSFWAGQSDQSWRFYKDFKVRVSWLTACECFFWLNPCLKLHIFFCHRKISSVAPPWGTWIQDALLVG